MVSYSALDAASFKAGSRFISPGGVEISCEKEEGPVISDGNTLAEMLPCREIVNPMVNDCQA